MLCVQTASTDTDLLRARIWRNLEWCVIHQLQGEEEEEVARFHYLWPVYCTTHNSVTLPLPTLVAAAARGNLSNERGLK